MNSLYIYFFLFAVAFAIMVQIISWRIKVNKNKFDDILNDLYNPDYPKIDIKAEVTGKPIHFEYPYIIMGTCNKIDYISQRFRGWPTPFQIDRFRYHCIYEYEKSGKSKVIDYADCDGYEVYEVG